MKKLRIKILKKAAYFIIGGSPEWIRYVDCIHLYVLKSDIEQELDQRSITKSFSDD